MKNIISLFSSVALFSLLFAPLALADKPAQVDAQGLEVAWVNTGCADIKSGTITDGAGNVITAGYDEFGYNYQAHMFNGTYDSSDRVLDGKYFGSTVYYADDKLIMKWSDEWIANVDCDGDGKLDRGLENGIVGGISKGWLTNHVTGDYTDSEGTHTYTDFIKIGWTGPGSPLWGQYTILMEVYNDPDGGYNGLYSKLGAPGFGLNDHWTE